MLDIYRDLFDLTHLNALSCFTFSDVLSMPECRASYIQCASELTRKMTSSETNDQLQANFLAQLASRCQGNSASTAVTSMSLFSAETLQYMAPLQPVMIPFPSPPPSPLHVSPVLPASTSLTRDIGSESPSSASITRNSAFVSSQGRKIRTPAQSSSVWRPW